jgi:hypothetical protein
MKIALPLLILVAICAMVISCTPPPMAATTIDEKPMQPISDNMIGIWKMREDTNAHDYYVVEPYKENAYCVSYMNRGGDNRRIEHARVFFSEINNVKFINVPYGNPFDEPPLEDGYIFLRVMSHDHNGFEMTALVVNDPGLKGLSNSGEIRKRIAANMDKPSYYAKDTLHFRKKLPMGQCR